MKGAQSAYKQWTGGGQEDEEEGTLMNTKAATEDEEDEEEYENYFGDDDNKPGMDQKKVALVASLFGVGIIILIVFALGGGTEP